MFTRLCVDGRDLRHRREPICEDPRVSDRDQAAAIPAEPNASEQPHDVLAAEEFAMPAPEAARREGPVVLPPDPAGPDEEPHDVLAAEQFAMPAPRPRPAFAAVPPVGRSRRRTAGMLVGLGAALAALLHHRRKRA